MLPKRGIIDVVGAAGNVCGVGNRMLLLETEMSQ